MLSATCSLGNILELPTKSRYTIIVIIIMIIMIIIIIKIIIIIITTS